MIACRGFDVMICRSGPSACLSTFRSGYLICVVPGARFGSVSFAAL